jgi:hypothetical protein
MSQIWYQISNLWAPNESDDLKPAWQFCGGGQVNHGVIKAA